MNIRLTVQWLTAATLLGGPAAFASDAELRVTHVAEDYSRNRPAGAIYKAPTREKSELEQSALITRPKDIGLHRLASTANSDFWVYSADTDLLFDVDADGYYHYLRVRFDVDTYYEHAYVYAMLFLSADGETWEHFATTEDFLVEGSTGFDEYEVETEFVTGYPPGYYDVLIEIYDADFGDFVAEFGPAESGALSLLPIEDAEFDGANIAVTIIQEHGGGGAASAWLVAALVLLLGLARGPRRSYVPAACGDAAVVRATVKRQLGLGRRGRRRIHGVDGLPRGSSGRRLRLPITRASIAATRRVAPKLRQSRG